MRTSDLLMAMISTMYPSIGLMGSIIQAITSDQPNAGLSFALDLATSTLSTGNFVGDLTIELAKQAVIESLPVRHLPEATRRIMPYSTLPVICNRCKNPSSFYGQKGSEILCSDCIARDLSHLIHPDSSIYLLPNTIETFSSQIKEKNEVYTSYLTTRVEGSGVDIAPTRDNRIPVFEFRYINDDNIRWALAMWATLAKHWPSSSYLAIFDFSSVSWSSVERASQALTPAFKSQIGGGTEHIRAKVAVVHSMFRGNHETGSPDGYVTWGTFETRSEGFEWLRRYL